MKLGIKLRLSFGVRPQFLLKIVLKIFLLMSIPLFLLYAFRTGAIFYIIIYLQMLMIWPQAEIGLRQHNLSRAKFGPYFTAQVEKAEEGTALTTFSRFHSWTHWLCHKFLWYCPGSNIDKKIHRMDCTFSSNNELSELSEVTSSHKQKELDLSKPAKSK